MQDAYRAAGRAILLSQPLESHVVDQLPSRVVDSVNDIVSGHYANVIRSSPVLAGAWQNSEAQDDIVAWVETRLESISKEADEEVAFCVLATGVACLNTFIQINWTGPLFELTLAEILVEGEDRQQALTKQIHQQCLKSLSVDSVDVYHLTEGLGWIAIARQILTSSWIRERVQSASFWAMRACFIHQQLLDEGAATLQEQIYALSDEASTRLGLEKDEDEQTTPIKIRHSLELALIHSYYGNDLEAYEKMKVSQAHSGFEWEVSGALGRRTKFQTFDTSQLVVLAESKGKNKSQATEGDQAETRRPETVDLNDDVLLENVAYTETEENQSNKDKLSGNLDPIDQCLLLAFCLNVKNTNPDHGLTLEQMEPYVNRVLENANNWMVHTMGLLLRSRLESNRSRTVERSALQLQALVDQIKVEDSGVDERMTYFYDLLLPSKWSMERELAGRFTSLGVFRSALDIYERLEMWEDVVNCYQILEQPAKAKEVLHTLLEQSPDSPKLLCILGDMNDDPSLWQKAWDISGRRFARAMRSLGSYHFKREDYALSLECYDKAVKINPLFESSWFVLGCAAMRIENWEKAQEAFKRVVSLDYENAEGWCNLAGTYLSTGRRLEAFHALKQAAKLKNDAPDGWRIWENYLFVAMSIGKFTDAIQAMQRIVLLRWPKVGDKAVDVELLQKMVDSIIQQWDEQSDTQKKNLAWKLQYLLEQDILTRITNSGGIWKICAKFYIHQKRQVDALDATIKSYRAYLQNADLETDANVFEEAANAAIDTVDMYETLSYSTREDGTPICPDWKYKSRTLLKSLMGRAQVSCLDTEAYERLVARVLDLKSQV